MPPVVQRRTLLIVGAAVLALVGGALLYFRPASEHPAPDGVQAPKPTNPAQQPSQTETATNGSNVKPAVRATPAPAPAAPLPEERTAAKVAEVIADYQHLVAEASAGNVDAQLKLFSALHTCSRAALTPAALDDRIKDVATRIPVDSPNYDVNVRSLTSEYQVCSQFNRPQIDEWRKWLSMAAATGDEWARRFYISFGRPDDPKSDTYLQDTRDYVANSRKYLADGLAAGDPQALLVTSNNYADYGNGVYDPDPIQQYAYLYAYCLATECKTVSLNQLQKLGAGLSPQDLSNATSQGQSIYKKCCAK